MNVTAYLGTKTYFVRIVVSKEKDRNEVEGQRKHVNESTAVMFVSRRSIIERSCKI